MANAKKCDRCGVFYRDANWLVYNEFRLYKRRGFQHDSVDLCAECLRSLKEWLDNTD